MADFDSGLDIFAFQTLDVVLQKLDVFLNHIGNESFNETDILFSDFDFYFGLKQFNETLEQKSLNQPLVVIPVILEVVS